MSGHAKVAIVDSGIGNFASICHAIARAGGEAAVARTAADFDAATHVILPGVGSFDTAIRTIESRGLKAALTRKVLEEKTPTLGICLGMQVLSDSSEEGSSRGLGWLPARTIRFSAPDVRVPHIGWNQIRARRPSPLLDGISDGARFYFAHSYHCVERDESDVIAMTDYGYPFASVIVQDNIVGTQFHPEKSNHDGHRLLCNFLAMSAH